MSGRRAEDVFFALMDAPTAERPAVLDRLCNGDTALRREVEGLLRFHDGGAGMLDAPPVVGVVGVVESVVSAGAGAGGEGALPAGTRLGEYTIQRLLGEGGMGAVYVARQERPSRTVALKVIRRGLASASLIRRFEHEAEVLGRLQHPGIAQIYEAGAAPVRGQEALGPVPFIAMELIEGKRLTEHAAALPLREKLSLMARVCAAVHHAHQRGVIHRDLKPANILVDQGNEPKVLDFGVARAADADLRVTTMQTGVGQLIGTLPYMSPEQVLADPGAIDTRSDVYSLGVILYQLLTGRLPHDLSSRSIPEAARVIRDEEPTKLSSVSRVFRGDVDTIVAKAIEKDPARRYQSAAELGADLERHLRGEPIAARADSILYVLRKQLRRYRLAVAAAGAVAATLVAFAVYASVQAGRSRAQAVREHGLKVKADETAARLADELSVSTIERGRLLAASGNTAAAETLLWPELLAHPDSRPALFALRSLYAHAPNTLTLAEMAYEPVPPAFSPDGAMCALSRRGSMVELRSGDLTQLVASVGPLDDAPGAMAFSPDGRWLAVGTGSGAVEMIDTSTWTVTRTLKGHGDVAQALAFSRDGRTMASGAGEGSIVLWDVASGLTVERLLEGGDRVTSLCFSPDGRTLAAGERNGAVGLWDLTRGRRTAFLAGKFFTAAICYSPDGAALYTASSTGEISVRDPATAAERGALHSAIKIIRTASIAADGKLLLVCGDGGIEQWALAVDSGDVGAAKVVRACLDKGARYYGALRPAAVGEGGGETGFATVGDYSVARAWQLASHGGVRTLAPAVRRWRPVAFMPGEAAGVLLAVPKGSTTTLQLLDPAGRAETVTVLDGLTDLNGLAPAGDGRAIGCFSTRGNLYELSADARHVMRHCHVNGQPTSMTWLAPQRYAVIIAGVVHVWDASTDGPPRRVEGIGGTPAYIARRPGTAGGAVEIAVAGRAPNLAVYTLDLNTATAVKRGEYAGGPRMWFTAYSPAGDVLLASASDRTIVTLDASTLEVRARMVGTTNALYASSFSPGGEMVAVSTSDGQVNLYESATGRLLTDLEPGDQRASALGFSRDGRFVLTATDTGEVHVHDLGAMDRHVAGNLAFQKAWQKQYAGKVWETPGLDAWAEGVLSAASRR